MKQTNQFQLNLIEATDPFEVAPINENTQTLEDALVAHGQAADAHSDIRTALSSHVASKANPHGVTAAQVGAAAESHNHSAANITSGTLPVTRGGTGSTSVDTAPTAGSTKMITSGGVYTALSKKAGSDHTHSNYYSSNTSRAANTVLAAPNGSAGEATFRKLVATDIPNLSADKLTAGTLPVTRGGTGNTSVDTAPTSGSTKMVTSGGVYTALSGKAATATYEATVTTSWTASGNYYYQNITVTGITANDNPIVGIKTGTDNDANKLYHKSLGKVIRIVTAANKITVYATEKISTAFPIQLKVVR